MEWMEEGINTHRITQSMASSPSVLTPCEHAERKEKNATMPVAVIIPNLRPILSER